jgi:hypothetical protein
MDRRARPNAPGGRPQRHGIARASKGACARVALVSMTVSASFGLAGCAAINDLKVSLSQWFDTNFTAEGEVSPANAPEAAPVITPERIPKEAAKAPRKKINSAARKLQRPQTVVLPPKKPPISDSPETARLGETEGQSAPPASMRLRTPFPEAPPPGIFSR